MISLASGDVTQSDKICHSAKKFLVSFGPYSRWLLSAYLISPEVEVVVKSWCSIAHRALVLFMQSSTRSLKKKKQTVDSLLIAASMEEGVIVIVVTHVANCSSSIKNLDKTDLPYPGPAETQRRLEDWLSRHVWNLSSVRNHSQVPGTLFWLRFLYLFFTGHTNEFTAIFAQLINVLQLVSPKFRASQTFPCARELRFGEVAYNMSLVYEEQ